MMADVSQAKRVNLSVLSVSLQVRLRGDRGPGREDRSGPLVRVAVGAGEPRLQRQPDPDPFHVRRIPALRAGILRPLLASACGTCIAGGVELREGAAEISDSRRVGNSCPRQTQLQQCGCCCVTRSHSAAVEHLARAVGFILALQINTNRSGPQTDKQSMR